MIKGLRLLHYLSEETYKKLCHKLNVDDSDCKIADNIVNYPQKAIYSIHPFNIFYKHLGHIVWFLYVNIDFPKFKCSYADFQKMLFEQYLQLFGKDIMSDFPAFEQINCDYVEYVNKFKVNNSNKIIKYLSEIGLSPEQLDKNKWESFKKPHGTIGLCVSKIDDSYIEILAPCYGSALKSRIKDKSFHVATGVSAAKIMLEQTEKDIMDWLIKKYKIMD